MTPRRGRRYRSRAPKREPVIEIPDQRDTDAAEYERLMRVYRRAMIAADLYFSGGINGEIFQMHLADCSLRAQGVEQPTYNQVKKRFQEMDVAYSFLSPAPHVTIPDN